MAHTLPFHPVTEIFPLMEAAAFTALVDDIDRHGQKEPILIQDGQVIDGRHRMQACERLGIEPWVREIRTEDGDPLALVISLNLHRRHLTESQRAMVAGRWANLPNGIRADRSSANLQSVPPRVIYKPLARATVSDLNAHLQLLAAQITADTRRHRALKELRDLALAMGATAQSLVLSALNSAHARTPEAA